ncbi:MAG: hypothetical protein JJU02_09310 [Cryomorphaceae bacterium]|nr:hypothetical protein [Cryomorphaceae bacterium]
METIVLKIDSVENAKRIADLLTMLKGVTDIQFVNKEADLPNKVTKKAMDDASSGKTIKTGDVDELLELLEK